MYVKVDRHFSATLEDVQDFRAFKLVVSNAITDWMVLTDKVPELVHAVERNHAWLSQDAVEKLGPADANWIRQYRAMLAYAETKGWTRGVPPEVAAHVEVQSD